MILKEELKNNPQFQPFLYDKGFLLTSDREIRMDDYPFYGNWEQTNLGEFALYTHKKARLFSVENSARIVFLIGHAFNPIRNIIDENEILTELSFVYGTTTFFDMLNELTGIFVLGVIDEKHLEIVSDASGMQYVCYGTVNGKVFITSHMRLIGDIEELKTADYVKRLVSYKYYPYMLGNYLPGDLTCYEELKRLIPNTSVFFDGEGFHIKRFYPSTEISMCNDDAEYWKVIKEACEILQSTMKIIPEKWARPAISLTGGIDSNTTFAAANGCYDKYSTFSYVSMYRESVDAEKAETISKAFDVPYKRYDVPEENTAFDHFELYKEIFKRNGGDIGRIKDNDSRKKIELIRSDVCDVEVKSWISETIRAYCYKYFGRKKFRRSLKPRDYTSLYKVFLFNRGLVHKTDRYFKEYIDKTELKKHLFNYDESDFFVWEMMHGGKCGLNIGVMKSCFDITIPYNNRKLIDLLLRVPLEKRISDQHHLDMKQLMNRELFDLNIRVVNLNETKRRKKLLNTYYVVNTSLPF